MTQYILSVLLFSTISSAALAREPEHIFLTRALMVESCEHNKCLPLKTFEAESTPRTEIVLQEFSKGATKGMHGEEKFQVYVDKTPFKSEIFLNKVKNGYSVYAVVRSGHGTKRHGSTKKVFVENISAFEPLVLQDQIFYLNKKAYRAKLTISPAAAVE